MVIEIDFNSDEALYLQLRNQIVLGIATSRFREGVDCNDGAAPSVHFHKAFLFQHGIRLIDRMHINPDILCHLRIRRKWR